MNASQVTVGAVLSGRYKLTATMAAGGMAQVWRAHDNVLNRPVAVKVLHPHLATDESFVSRFRREAISSARLQHSSIVAVYDTVSENGIEAIVMELIEGRTLRSILDQSAALPPSTVIQIGIQVADALAVAHQAGTVHRDIKPANIMIDNEMRVVVTDFGIAKANRDADLTDAGTLLGTAKYLAPEQVTGDPIDPRADLYALGLVMFEAVTGEPPFNAETDAATALARLQGPVPRCRDRSPSVPAGLDAIVAKAMAQSPDDRFERAVVMKEALVNADLSSPFVDDFYGAPPANGSGAGQQTGFGYRPASATQADRVPSPLPQASLPLVPPPLTSPPLTSPPLAPPPHGPPSQFPPSQVPLPPSPLQQPDGTAVMTPDMIRGETGEVPVPPGQPASRRRSKRSLVGRGLFVLLFVAALAVAGLLAMTGSFGGDGAGTEPLVLTRATSTDPQGDDLEEREDRVDNAIDGNANTTWFTRSYTSPNFSGLKDGVGLAVFFDGRQLVGEITIESTTSDWSAEFYLIDKDFDSWVAEDRQTFDPGGARKLVNDHSGSATVDLSNATGRGVVIWITDHGSTVGNDGNLYRRMVISEVGFR
ncbi:MAG: protein kinase [Acidimicrobiia bacterium]|nr:protein kinase [Acidimicrobiia bacterium]